MKFYVGEITSKLIRSPFREDTKPTCGFYYGKTGRLYLHDFGTDEHFDCIEIVKRKFKIGYIAALNQIINDSPKFEGNVSTELNEEIKLEYISGPPKFDYFNKLGITDKTLKKYGVVNARAVYADESLLWRSTENNPIFIYQFPSSRFKAYRPLSKDSTKKWKSNSTIEDVSGFHQLPKSSKLLVITSSMKDVMLLRELGYNAIAFNSEGIPTKGENGKFVAGLFEELKLRFEKIVFFMDNDLPGKQYSLKLTSHYRIPHILIPDNEPKDISDYAKKYGLRRTKRMFNKLIKKFINESERVFSVPF